MYCIDLYIIEKVYPAKFFSIHCVNTSGLKLNFEKGISIQCFRRRPQQVSLSPLHCDVDVLTVTDENRKRCIFPMFRGLKLLLKSIYFYASMISTNI